MSSQAKQTPALLTVLMEARDMRSEELAFRLHVSHRTVTRWLAGENMPTPTMARRLGEFFGVDWRRFYEEAA